MIRPTKTIEDPLSDEERAKFEKLIGPPPAAFPKCELPQALILEDEPGLREVFSTVLKPWDLDIIAVGSGVDALKAMATRRIDFMLVDLRVPGIDGFQVIRCARSYLKLRQTEIIVITGSTEARDEIVALNLGADSFMRKPMNLETLRARLKPMVRRLYDRLG